MSAWTYAGCGFAQASPSGNWRTLSGIAQPKMSAYESGKLTPNPATLSRFAKATAVRPSALLGQMRDAIVAVAARHHASNVRVFGSVATGSDTPSSDLDLLVHFSDEASLYDQVGLTLELQDLLGVSVDVISDGVAGVDHITHVVCDSWKRISLRSAPHSSGKS